jgi:hypothetical protein
MAPRKQKPSVTYELLSIPLSGYKASVDASVNHHARDKRHQYTDPKIYSFGTSVELEGLCDYPDERSGDRYIISVQGWETEEGEFEARLSGRIHLATHYPCRREDSRQDIGPCDW